MTINLQVGTATIVNRIPIQASKLVVDIGTASILQRIPADAVQPIPWWGDEPEPWEAVWLDGTRLPGYSWIAGQVGLRTGRRRSPGVHGDNRVQYGYEAAKLQVHLVIWTKKHLDALTEQLPKLRPRAARGQPAPVTISHPATAVLGINFVEVIHVSLLRQDEPGMDVYSCELDLLEHIPQPTANKGKVQVPSLANVKTAFPTGTTKKTQPGPASQTAVKPSTTNAGP